MELPRQGVRRLVAQQIGRLIPPNTSLCTSGPVVSDLQVT
jgi:hypothetical protein